MFAKLAEVPGELETCGQKPLFQDRLDVGNERGRCTVVP